MANDDRLAQLLKDLAYFKNAVASVRVGGQPPTLYAEKYVADMECLLQIAGLEPTPAPEEVKSQLELALDHDSAGRVERKPRKS